MGTSYFFTKKICLDDYFKYSNGSYILKNYLIALIAILVFSAPWCIDRILKYPEPENESRYHHHFGDGATEQVWVIPAVSYWQRNGLLENWAIPCDKKVEKNCIGYTHYPPGSFIFSYFLFQLKGGGIDQALAFVRFVHYALTVILSALAVTLICASFSSSAWLVFVMGIFIGSSYGFRIYADNIFSHGIGLAVLGR